MLYVLKTAYRELEEQVEATPMPRGAKTEIVRRAIEGTKAAFRVADIQRSCPGVSVDLIRRTLKAMRAAGEVDCLGRGRNAQWRKTK